MLMGARIMEVTVGAGTDGHRELSGAIYPFSKLAEATVLTQTRQVMAGYSGFELHIDNQRDLLELAIARAWRANWFAPAPLPQIQDASTGDPLLLLTDHYRVLDAAALAASLASQADVSGDAQQGWNRMIEGADGAQRSLSTINPGRSTDRVELFHRTQWLADGGLAWFEGLAGVAVQHLTREITDPAGHRASAPSPLRQLGRRDDSRSGRSLAASGQRHPGGPEMREGPAARVRGRRAPAVRRPRAARRVPPVLVGHLGNIAVSTGGTRPARSGDTARVLTIDLEELI